MSDNDDVSKQETPEENEPDNGTNGDLLESNSISFPKPKLTASLVSITRYWSALAPNPKVSFPEKNTKPC